MWHELVAGIITLLFFCVGALTTVWLREFTGLPALTFGMFLMLFPGCLSLYYRIEEWLREKWVK